MRRFTVPKPKFSQRFKARSIKNISEATLNSVVDLETIAGDFTSNDPMNGTSMQLRLAGATMKLTQLKSSRKNKVVLWCCMRLDRRSVSSVRHNCDVSQKCVVEAGLKEARKSELCFG